MKTAEEWFQLLPEDIRNKAHKCMVPRLKRKNCYSLQEAITRSLDWGKYRSKEWKMWRELRDDIRNGKLMFETGWYQIY
jgi:hypothetical protein